MWTKTITKCAGAVRSRVKAINAVVWSPKRLNSPMILVENPFFIIPPLFAQGTWTFEQLLISHEVQLRFTKFLRRCIPVVDAVMQISLASSNPTYSLFEGPKMNAMHERTGSYYNSSAARTPHQVRVRLRLQNTPPRFDSKGWSVDRQSPITFPSIISR